MMKNLLLIVVVLISALAAADYASLLGTREMQMAHLLHLRAKPVDATTGQTLVDVHVTCVRRGSEEVCSQGAPAADGVLTLNFMVQKSAVFSRVFRFRKSETLHLAEQGEVFLVFIAPNHERLFLQVKTADIREWGEQVKTVPLTPENQGGGAS